MDWEYIVKYLKENTNVFKKSKHQNSKLYANGYSKYSCEQIAESLPQYDTFFKQFNNLREMVYCLNHKIEKRPVCNICGGEVGFLNQSLGFAKTCNNQACKNKHWQSTLNHKEIQKKRKNTFIEKYGTTSYANEEKAKKTKLEKYGNEFFNNFEQSRKTCLKKYGVEYYSQLEESTQRMRDTCLKKYGVDSYAKLEESINKRKQTCLEKYGVEHFTQTQEYMKHARKKYYYNNIFFDSSWELAFYIYYKDRNINILREPVRLSYVYKNKVHYYFPDFGIDNQLYEIKGDMLLKNGKLSPGFYQLNQCKTEEEKHELLELYHEKQKCMTENNVIVISKKDIQKYFKYIKDNYSNNFIKQFKK